MDKYIVGIDGGGTKTRGVLFDFHGTIIREVIKGPSNIMVNERVTQKNIEEVLNLLLENIPPNEIAMIQIGLAGASKYPHKKAFINHLISKYNVCCANLSSDIEMAIHAIEVHHDQSAILVVSGTGSAIMAKDRNAVFMVGGYGHLLGDEGSAYHVVIKAFRKIIDDHDRGRMVSDFAKKVLEIINAKDVEDIKTFVYGHDKSDIAQLSQVLAGLAISGDMTAIRLFKSEGLLLANQLIKAYDRLKHKDDIVIALKGGFIEQAPFVKESLIRKINQVIPKYTVQDTTLDPICGAYHMAKRFLGGIVK